MMTRRLLAGVYLSGVVFVALTCPLAWLGNKHMTLELNDETIFSGTARRATAPYLIVCSVLGASIGIASVAYDGWRATAQQQASLESENSQLKQELERYQQELEDILLYSNRLQSMALDGFFPEDVPNASLRDEHPSTADHQRTTIVKPYKTLSLS